MNYMRQCIEIAIKKLEPYAKDEDFINLREEIYYEYCKKFNLPYTRWN